MWLVLTDEEWVRQNMIAYLITVARYPVTMIALEKEFSVGELKKRFDILVYDLQYKPWMLVECKSPAVPLSEAVIRQVLGYNVGVPVPYIIISNGNSTWGWKKDGGQMNLLEQLPAWPPS